MNNDVELIPVKGVLPSVQVQSDNVIYVPQAHKNKAGIVKEGDGVLIENGVVSLNKQTVEDMIDANKWVSYGFKQNLTEDEKGMARHNIGAGDNYFTGSYYDLTQKPHLNTNNTTGLDYGDEELNDTINLHKISKTGSFNDLKHVPQETLAFAESERQKSKNLFKSNFWNKSSNVFEKNGITFTYNPDDYSITMNGTATTRALCYLNPDALSYIGVGTYTFSGFNQVTPLETAYVQAYNKALNKYPALLYSNYSKRTVSFTDVKFTDLYISVNAGASCNNLVLKFQIEEGSVATEYQPYNGAIVHEKEIADVEHIETIYEAVSSDTNINWGQTSGIKADTSVNGVVTFTRDLSQISKYKYLKAIFAVGGYSFCTIYCESGKFTGNTSSTFRGIGGGYAYYLSSSSSIEFVISIDTAKITYRARVRDNNGVVTNSTDANVRLMAIEGVY